MNEEPDIFPKETIKALSELYLVLKGIRLRLDAEGYVFGEDEIRNKEGELLHIKKDGKWISVK